MRRLAATMAFGLLLGCGDLPPQGQLLVYVDTDASVPDAERPDAVGLFDAMRIDVFVPGENLPCEGCTRELSVDRASFAARDVSFGVPVEPEVEGYRLRVRLYTTTASLDGGLPSSVDGPPPSVVDVIAALPVAEAEGVQAHHLRLHTDDVGRPRGSSAEPVALEPGPPERSWVGRWSGAETVDCPDVAPPGFVCIPGGAFWLGHPFATGVGIGDENTRRRLVRLAPFYVQTHEVTIAEYRAWLEPQDIEDGDPRRPIDWSGENKGFYAGDYCRYTRSPGAFDDQPVTCVEWEGAAAYCAAMGGRLPTEAQLEYVAGGLRGALFVWGNESPRCEDAVLARYGEGIFGGDALENLVDRTEVCEPAVSPGGAEPTGDRLERARRDRLERPDGVVYDLVGNVAEWTRDIWQPQDGPCWTERKVYVDPECTAPPEGEEPQNTFRLGSYAVGARQAMAAYRGFLPDISGFRGIDLGFRCVIEP